MLLFKFEMRPGPSGEKDSSKTKALCLTRPPCIAWGERSVSPAVRSRCAGSEAPVVLCDRRAHAPRNNQKTRAVFGTFHKVYHKKSRLYTPNFTLSFDTGKFSRPLAENRIVPGLVLCYNQLIKLETYSYLHPVTERRNAL